MSADPYDFDLDAAPFGGRALPTAVAAMTERPASRGSALAQASSDSMLARFRAAAQAARRTAAAV